MKHQTRVARRTFLRNTLAASAAIPLAGIPIILRADHHRVDEAHPSAVSLGYRHDAAATARIGVRRCAGQIRHTF